MENESFVGTLSAVWGTALAVPTTVFLFTIPSHRGRLRAEVSEESAVLEFFRRLFMHAAERIDFISLQRTG